MKKLAETIKILSVEESELLEADKLAKSRWINTGLYLVCGENYTAFDYGERQSWIDFFGKGEAPKGHKKEFENVLEAIDWLLELR